MGRVRAAAGKLLFLAVAPSVVGGLMPWTLTGWRSAGPPMWLRILGWVLLGSGAAVLLEAFGRFVIEGIGTPAPVAPTEKLVVGGLYRYVRNPHVPGGRCRDPRPSRRARSMGARPLRRGLRRDRLVLRALV